MSGRADDTNGLDVSDLDLDSPYKTVTICSSLIDSICSVLISDNFIVSLFQNALPEGSAFLGISYAQLMVVGFSS